MMRVSRAACVAAALACAAPAHAEEQGKQMWINTTVSAPLAPRVDASLELQPRFDLEGDRQLLIRPSLTYRVSSTLSLTAGYLYFRNDPDGGRVTHEHRTWQQAAYPLAGEASGVRLTGRTRLEQRFRADDGDVGWRLRQQLRIQAPIDRERAIDAIAWNETFVGLGDTRWGARSGIDQTRTFLGLGLPLTGRARLEAGYLNQLVVRAGPDRVNHAALLTLNVRLPSPPP